MLVSDDNEKIEKVRFWATQSRDKAMHYEHSELGFNYRMSNVVAGIGRGQLKILEDRIKKKKYIFNYYKDKLSTITDIEFMPTNDWDDSNRWLTCITLKGDKILPLDIMIALENENIESRPIWKPMHLQPYYKEYDFITTNNVSDDIFNRGVCLPSDTKMTNDDLDKVIEIIKGLWC